MKDLVRRVDYQPKVIKWLIFFSFAVFVSVFLLIGPLFLGYILFRMAKTGLIKSFAEVYWPAVIGIIFFHLFFGLLLSSWPIESFIVITFFSIGCFFSAPGWYRFMS